MVSVCRLLKKDELIKAIKERNETVYFTVGYRWKSPTTLDKPLTPEEALAVVERGGYLFQLRVDNGKFHLDAYTDSDMW